MARIDIWQFPLDVPAPRRAALAAHLSGDERARAARFVHPLHGARFEAGRGRLREILGAAAGCAPGALRFEYGPQGKPHARGAPPFNLSHSGGLAMLALSDGPQVGLDVEAWKAVEPAVAERFFTPAERAELAAMDFALGFFRCWTRKEAVIKAVGLGLSMPLSSFDVTLAETPRLARIEGGTGGWHLADLSPGPGLSAALALRDPDGPPRIVRHEG